MFENTTTSVKMRMWMAFILLIFITFLARASTAPLEKRGPKSNRLYTDKLSAQIEDNNSQFTDEDESLQSYSTTHEVEETTEYLINGPLDKRKLQVLSKHVSNLDDVRDNRKKSIMEKIKPKHLDQKKTKDKKLEKPIEDRTNVDKTKASDGYKVHGKSSMDLTDISNSISNENSHTIVSDEFTKENMNIASVEKDLIEDMLSSPKLNSIQPGKKISKKNKKIPKNNIAPKLQRSSEGETSQPPRKSTKPTKQNTENIMTDIPDDSILPSNNNIPENIPQPVELSTQQTNKNSDKNNKAQDIFNILNPTKKIKPYKSKWKPTESLSNNNDFIFKNGKMPFQSTLKPSELSKVPNATTLLNDTSKSKRDKEKTEISKSQTPISEIPQKLQPKYENNMNTLINSDNRIESPIFEENELIKSQTPTDRSLDSSTTKNPSKNNPNNPFPFITSETKNENPIEPESIPLISKKISDEPMNNSNKITFSGDKNNDLVQINQDMNIPEGLNRSHRLRSKVQNIPKKEINKKRIPKIPDNFKTQEDNEIDGPVFPDHNIVPSKTKFDDDLSNVNNIPSQLERNLNDDLNNGVPPNQTTNKSVYDDELREKGRKNLIPKEQNTDSLWGNRNEKKPDVSDINSTTPQSTTGQTPNKNKFKKSIPQSPSKLNPQDLNEMVNDSNDNDSGTVEIIVIEASPEETWNADKLNQNANEDNRGAKSLEYNAKNKQSEHEDIDSAWKSKNEEDPNASDINSTTQPPSKKKNQGGKLLGPLSKKPDELKSHGKNEKDEPILANNHNRSISSEIEVLFDGKENPQPEEQTNDSPWENENEPGTSDLNGTSQPKSEKIPKRGKLQGRPSKKPDELKRQGKNEKDEPIFTNNRNDFNNSQIDDLLDGKENPQPGEQDNDSPWENENEPGTSDLNGTSQPKSEKIPKRGNLQGPLSKKPGELKSQGKKQKDVPISPNNRNDFNNSQIDDLLDGKENPQLGEQDNDSPWENENEPGTSDLNGTSQPKSEKIPKRGNLQGPLSKKPGELKSQGKKQKDVPISPNNRNDFNNSQIDDQLDGKENPQPGEQDNDSPWENENEPGTSDLNGTSQPKSEIIPKRGKLQGRPSKKPDELKRQGKNEKDEPIFTNNHNRSISSEIEDLLDGKENPKPGEQDHNTPWGNENEPGKSDVNGTSQPKSEKIPKRGKLQGRPSKKPDELKRQGKNEKDEPIFTNNHNRSISSEIEDLLDGKENPKPVEQDNNTPWGNDNEPGKSDVNGTSQPKLEKISKRGKLQGRPSKKPGELKSQGKKQKDVPISPNNRNDFNNSQIDDLLDGKENPQPGEQDNDSPWENENEPGTSDLNGTSQPKSEKIPKRGKLQGPLSKKPGELKSQGKKQKDVPISTNNRNDFNNSQIDDLLDGKENPQPGEQDNDSPWENENEPGTSDLNGTSQPKSEKIPKRGNLQGPLSKKPGELKSQGKKQKDVPISPNNRNEFNNSVFDDLLDGKENPQPEEQNNDSPLGNKNEPSTSYTEKIPKGGKFQRPPSIKPGKLKRQGNIKKDQSIHPYNKDNSPNIEFDELENEDKTLLNDPSNKATFNNGNPRTHMIPKLGSNEEDTNAISGTDKPTHGTDILPEVTDMNSDKSNSSKMNSMSPKPQVLNDYVEKTTSPIDDSINVPTPIDFNNLENKKPTNSQDKLTELNTSPVGDSENIFGDIPMLNSNEGNSDEIWDSDKSLENANIPPKISELNTDKSNSPIIDSPGSNPQGLNDIDEITISRLEDTINGPLISDLYNSESKKSINSQDKSSELKTRPGGESENTFGDIPLLISNDGITKEISVSNKSYDELNIPSEISEPNLDKSNSPIIDSPVSERQRINDNDEKTMSPADDVMSNPTKSNINNQETEKPINSEGKSTESKTRPGEDSENIFGDIPMLNSNEEISDEIWGSKKSLYDTNIPPEISELKPDLSNSPIFDSPGSKPQVLNDIDEKPRSSVEDAINKSLISDLNNSVTKEFINSERKSSELKTSPGGDSENIFGDIPMISSNEKNVDDLSDLEKSHDDTNIPPEISELNPDKSNSSTNELPSSEPGGLNDNDEKPISPVEDAINKPTTTDFNISETEKHFGSESKSTELKTSPGGDSENIFGDIPMISSNEKNVDDLSDLEKSHDDTNIPPEISELNPDKSNSSTNELPSSEPGGLNDNDEKPISPVEDAINKPTTTDFNISETEKHFGSESKSTELKTSPGGDSENIFGDIPMISSNEKNVDDISDLEKSHDDTNIPPEISELNPDKPNTSTNELLSSEPGGLNDSDEKPISPVEDAINKSLISDLNIPVTKESINSEGKSSELKTSPGGDSENIFGDIPMISSNEKNVDNLSDLEKSHDVTNISPEISELNPDKSNTPTNELPSSEPGVLNDNDEKSISPVEDAINKPTTTDFNISEIEKHFSSESKSTELKTSPGGDSENIFGDIPMISSNEKNVDDLSDLEKSHDDTNIPPEISELNPNKSNTPTNELPSSEPGGLNDNDEKPISPVEDAINKPTTTDFNISETEKHFGSESKSTELKTSPGGDSENIFGDIPMISSNEKNVDDLSDLEKSHDDTNIPPEISELNPNKSNTPTNELPSSEPGGLNDNDEKPISPVEDAINKPTTTDFNISETEKHFGSESKSTELKTSPGGDSENIFGDIPMISSNEKNVDDLSDFEKSHDDTNIPPEISELNPDKSNSPTNELPSSEPGGLNDNDEKPTSPVEDVINEPTANDFNFSEIENPLNSKGKSTESKTSLGGDSENTFGDIPMVNSNEENTDEMWNVEYSSQGTNGDDQGIQSYDENIEKEPMFNYNDILKDHSDISNGSQQKSSEIKSSDKTKTSNSNLSPNVDSEELFDDDEKLMKSEESVSEPTTSDYYNTLIEKPISFEEKPVELEISSSGESENIKDINSDLNSPDLKNQHHVTTIPLDKTETFELNTLSSSYENEKNKGDSIFSNSNIGLPILSAPSEPINKKPKKSKTCINSSSLNNFGDISILSSGKKNSGEIKNTELLQPSMNKSDHNYMPFENAVNNYTAGNQSNTHKEKNPNKFKNSGAKIIDKSSSGPSKILVDVKLNMPSTELLSIPKKKKNKINLDKSLFSDPKTESNKSEYDGEITVPNSDESKISYANNGEKTIPNSFIPSKPEKKIPVDNSLQGSKKLVNVPNYSTLDTNQKTPDKFLITETSKPMPKFGAEPSNNRPIDAYQDMQLSKPNAFPSPDFIKKKGFNQYGYMIPKFSNNYDCGNSNYDLWESLPPKKNIISNFNNDLETKKPMMGSYHSNVVSNNVNIDKNVSTKTENIKKNEENSNDSKLNNKYEMYDNFIKSMTDKVLGRIDDINSKISKMEKNNSANNINNEDRVKIDNLKNRDSSIIRKQRKKLKKEMNTISPDSSLDESSDDIENLNSNESDESNDIKDSDKITNKSKQNKKKKETRKNDDNTTKKKKKERENGKTRKKNNYNDTKLEQSKSKKRKSKNIKKITSDSEMSSSEADDIINVETIDESYESIEDLKNNRNKKKTLKKKKKKKNVPQTNSKQIKRLKKRPVKVDSEDKQTNINKNNYAIEENYERNIISNDGKQTKKTMNGKNRRNKNVVKKKKIETNTIKTDNETKITKNGSDTETNDGYQLVTFYPLYANTNPFSRLFSRARPTYRI